HRDDTKPSRGRLDDDRRAAILVQAPGSDDSVEPRTTGLGHKARIGVIAERFDRLQGKCRPMHADPQLLDTRTPVRGGWGALGLSESQSERLAGHDEETMPMLGARTSDSTTRLEARDSSV